jgi:hypothetical protein
MMEATRAEGSVWTNPYVFIVGCARSGTTLLQRMLDAHPDLAVIHETHWIPKWYERRKGVTPEGLATPELVRRLAEYHRFAGWRIGREELERLVANGEPVPYPSFVAGFFDLYGKERGKRLVGDKTPRYVRNLPTLHELWPGARFVHLIRDGRNVALSATNWRKSYKLARRFPTWREDPTTTAAVWWEWLVRLGRQDGNPLGPNLYHEVRYESLVSEPAKACQKLCSFLGLPYDDAMLHFHKGREKAGSDLDAKGAWLPVTRGLRDWRSEMPAEEVERFEAAAGDLLDEVDYPRAFPHPSRGALERAREIRASFRRDVRERGDRSLEVWET